MCEIESFADLLPSSVEVVHALGELGEVPHVWPEEAASVACAVPRRQAEFATTRECARQALERLGYLRCAIPVGAHREPIWPPGAVGSLTHGAGLFAAAVAPESAWRSVGIDVEHNSALPTGTPTVVADAAERSALALLAASEPLIAWDRLLFSAKEAIFKAWFPITGTWLDFTECTVRIDAPGAMFRGVLHPEGDTDQEFGITAIEGHWGLMGSRLLTAVVVPHDEARKR